MPAQVGVGDPLKLTGEVTWRCAIETAMNENGEVEVNPLSVPQVVELVEKRRHVLTPPCRVHKSGGGI